MESKRLFWIGVIDIVVIAIGATLSAIIHHMAFLAVAVTTVAIVTFFGVLTGGNVQSNESVFRRAITVAVVTVYLVLVSLVSFFGGGWESPEVATTLLVSFTSIVGVIVAFYFGSSAYLELRRSSNSEDQPKEHGKND